MVLAKQQIDVQLGLGLDTDVDPKRQVPGSLAVLENAVFDKRGRLSKRKGFRELSAAGGDAEPTNIIARQISIGSGGKLLAWGLHGVSEYSEEINDWGPAHVLEDPGTAHPVLYRVHPIPCAVETSECIGQISAEGSASATQPIVDLAVIGDFVAVAVQETSASSITRHRWISELSTRRVLHHSTEVIVGSATRFRVAQDGRYFVFLEDIDTAADEIQVKRFDTQASSVTLAATPSSTTLALSTGISNTDHLEIVSGSNGEIYFVYAEQTTNELTVDTITDGTSLANLVNSATHVVDTAIEGTILGFWNGAGLWIVFMGSLSAGARQSVATVINVSTGAVVASLNLGIVDTGASDRLVNGGIGGRRVTGAGHQNHTVLTRTVDELTGNTSRYVVTDRLQLAGSSLLKTQLGLVDRRLSTSQGDAPTFATWQQPQLVSAGDLFFQQALVHLAHLSVEEQGIEIWSNGANGQDPFNQQYFEPCAVVGVPAAKPQTAANSRTWRITDDADAREKILSAHAYTTEIFTINGNKRRSYGVRLVVTEVNPLEAFSRDEAQNVVYLAGGVLRLHDTSLTTAVPHESLEVFFLADSTGTVQYRVSHEAWDAHGNVHRGPTSGPRIAAAAPEDVSYPRPVWADFGRGWQARLVSYRTEQNGTVFHIDLIAQLFQSALANFGTTDANLPAAPLLASQRPGLEPIHVLGAKSIRVWNGRMWVAQGVLSGSLLPSKLLQSGRGAEFAGELEIRLDEGGDVRALAATSGVLLVFQRNRVLAIAGDGPDDNGANGAFSHPQIVLEGVGCEDPSSVIETPTGVFFRSDQGIRLLQGSSLAAGQNGEVGREVDEIVRGRTVLGSTVLEDRTLVLFSLEPASRSTAGDILAYDYSRGQWSRWVFPAGVTPGALAVFQDRVTFVDYTSNEVWIEKADGESGSFFDGGGVNDPVRLKLQTGWISLAGIAGYQRVRRVTVEGEVRSEDASPQVDVDVTIEADTSVSPHVRLWDDLAVGDVALQTHVRDQKSSRVRITVQDSCSAADDEGFIVQGVQLEVGVKAGQTRVAGSLKR
jgi:hypothetical protein